MKKFATRLLYVFSFSLLFTALYLNFAPQDQSEASLMKPIKKAEMSTSSFTNQPAVAQPEINTVFK